MPDTETLWVRAGGGVFCRDAPGFLQTAYI